MPNNQNDEYLAQALIGTKIKFFETFSSKSDSSSVLIVAGAEALAGTVKARRFIFFTWIFLYLLFFRCS